MRPQDEAAGRRGGEATKDDAGERPPGETEAQAETLTLQIYSEMRKSVKLIVQISYKTRLYNELSNCEIKLGGYLGIAYS